MPPVIFVDVHCADGIHAPTEDDIQHVPDADFMLPPGHAVHPPEELTNCTDVHDISYYSMDKLKSSKSSLKEW